METPLYRKPYYKKFYDPLDQRLKDVNVVRIAPGKHGWVDRYRTYRTDHEGLRFILVHDNDDGLAWAGVAGDPHSTVGELQLNVLLNACERMLGILGSSEIRFVGPFDIPGFFVATEAQFGDPDERQGIVRNWMFASLLNIKNAVRVCLDGSANVRAMKLTDLIAAAPWREAITYRETWPHEYVLLRKDGQRELLDAVCERFRNGEGVPARFFVMENVYLFIGDCKYWFMSDCDTIKSVLDSEDDEQEVVLNRARLYRDRRDFIIQEGDTGRREDYPVDPPHTRESP